MTTLALYPWEDIDIAVREQAEQEIWSDAEYQQWLDELLTVPVEEMGELEFMEYTLAQLEAQPAAEMLSFAEVTLRAPRSGGWSQALLDGEVEVLPAWQREDYVGA